MLNKNLTRAGIFLWLILFLSSTLPPTDASPQPQAEPQTIYEGGSPRKYAMPAWSPDSSQIAFISHDSYDLSGMGKLSGSGRSTGLFIGQTDGSGLREIDLGDCSPTEDWSLANPLWSPNGSHLAVTTFCPDGNSLAVFTIDLKANRIIKIDHGWAHLLEWSRDGQYLALWSSSGLYIADAAGQIVNSLTDNEYSISWGGWSPNGQSVAFADMPSEDGGLYVLDLENEPIQLAEFGENPVWSPDGRFLAFSTEADGCYVIGVDGNDLRKISGVAPCRWDTDMFNEGASSVAWLSDSSGIMWLSDETIFTASLQGDDPVQVALGEDAIGGAMELSADGSHLGISTDNQYIWLNLVDGSMLTKPGVGRNVGELSPQQNTLAIAGWDKPTDGFVQIINFETDAILATTLQFNPRYMDTTFPSLVWSPDGQSVALNWGTYLMGFRVEAETLIPHFAFAPSIDRADMRNMRGFHHPEDLISDDPAQALIQFNFAIEDDPADPVSYLGRAHTYLQLNQPEAATQDFWWWVILNYHSNSLSQGVFDQPFLVNLIAGHDEVVEFTAQAGQVLTVSAEAGVDSEIDPLLVLTQMLWDEGYTGLSYDQSIHHRHYLPLIADDNGGGDTKALIDGYVIPEDGTYYLWVAGASEVRGSVQVLMTLE